MELNASRKLAEVLRPNHPDVLAIKSNRSISLDSLGAVADTRQLRRRVIAKLEVALGPMHHSTRSARDADRLDWNLEPQPPSEIRSVPSELLSPSRVESGSASRDHRGVAQAAAGPAETAVPGSTDGSQGVTDASRSARR
jgi:hypothetical protein